MCHSGYLAVGFVEVFNLAEIFSEQIILYIEITFLFLFLKPHKILCNACRPFVWVMICVVLFFISMRLYRVNFFLNVIIF